MKNISFDLKKTINLLHNNNLWDFSLMKFIDVTRKIFLKCFEILENNKNQSHWVQQSRTSTSLALKETLHY